MVLKDVGNDAPEKLATLPTRELLLAYLTWKRRHVSAVPRQIKFAQGLLISSAYLQFKVVIDEIVRKIETGDSIYGHLSTAVLPSKILNKPDSLLSDWGVHHLHLSLEQHHKTPALLGRTGPVLWVIFTLETAHLIGVFPHKPGEPWVEDEVLETVIREWNGAGVYTKSLRPMGLETTVTLEKRKQARKHGWNALIEVDNHTWIPAFMTMSGHSMADADVANRTMLELPLAAANLIKRFPNRAQTLKFIPASNTVSFFNPETRRSEPVIRTYIY